MSFLEEFAKMIAEAQEQPSSPKSPAEYLARGTIDLAVWTATIDGHRCEMHDATDGFILAVAQGEKEMGNGYTYTITPDKRVMVAVFDHDDGAMRVLMSAEQAKELVNKLGTAISIAEQIDAEESTRQ